MQAKLKMEGKSAGIIDVEASELDELLEDVLEKEKTAKKKMKRDDGNKRKIVENEKTEAKDMRKQVWNIWGKMLKERKVLTQELQKRRVAGAKWVLWSI